MGAKCLEQCLIHTVGTQVLDPVGWHGSPPQYPCLRESHGQRSLAGYSPWDCKRVGHDSVTKQSVRYYYYLCCYFSLYLSVA